MGTWRCFHLQDLNYTPDDDWTKGRKLNRNVVKSRSKTETEPRADYDESSLVRYTTKMTKTQIKRSKRRSKKRAKDKEEPASEETRKSLATPSDSPLIHNVDSEEKGTSGIEQGNQPKTPIQNDLPENTETPSSNINSKRKFKEEMQPDAFTEFNPLDEDQEEIEMDSEVNGAFSETTPASSGIGGVHVKVITGDNWFAGRLKLKVTWSTEQSSWEELSDMKEDYPS
jgi:hypothetical protein